MTPTRWSLPLRSREDRPGEQFGHAAGIAAHSALHVHVDVEHVAGLVVVLPQGYALTMADGGVVDDRPLDHVTRIARLRDPPLEVLGVLGPPEQLPHGQPHRQDDLTGHDEAAPRRPHVERAVRLPGLGEDEGLARDRLGHGPQALETIGLRAHVVVEDPGVAEPRAEELGQRPGVATGRAGVHLRPHHPHRRHAGRAGNRLHRGAAGVVDHQHGVGRAGLTGHRLEAAGQRCRCIVGEHHGHDPTVHLHHVASPSRAQGRWASTNQPVSSRAASTTSPTPANQGSNSLHT